MTPRWFFIRLCLLALACTCTCTCAWVPPARGAEPVVESSQMPRVKPTEPQDAPRTFRLKPGFRLDLVAAEPLVVDPIAMSFDENGLLYVVEMRDYSERRPERLGRIRRLEDIDGDGRFDHSTVFADHLPWPTAVICSHGGVFVGSTPDIWWMRDHDGDGVAEQREVVFTGFASDFAPFATNKLNVQAMLNSFNWTLENRIHGATSFNGGKVHRVNSDFVRDWMARGRPGPVRTTSTPAAAGTRESAPTTAAAPVLDLRGRDFSFDPRTLEMRAESGGGQHGLSFDHRGRKFVCSNSSHVQAVDYEERYAGRNPHFNLPRALRDIAVDGGAAPVFRISPDEPWRVLRTQWRVAGLVPGPIEGGGKPSGYFTGATGVTIYRGDAYGEEFVGDAFVGDAGGNLVHRKKIVAEGVSVKAVRPDDEQNVEFLASSDNWFRPVQFANAPDGCLYICDMYREVIEHPWSLPQSLKQHLDLNSGNDRGRLYRVTPEKFKQPKPPRLATAEVGTLVALLDSPNGWHRDTASRLIFERQDRRALPLLQQCLEKSDRALGRMHALYSMAGLRALNETSLLRALADRSPDVRLHAVRLAESIITTREPGASTAVFARLVELARDPDELVRRQLAFTAGFLPRDWRLKVELELAKVAPRPSSGWPAPLLSSVGDEAASLFQELARQESIFSTQTEFMEGLAGILGARNQPEELKWVVEALAGKLGMGTAVAQKTPPGIMNTAASFIAGLDRAGSSLAKADPERRLAPIFMVAREIVNGSNVATAVRPSGEGKSGGGDKAAERDAAFTILGAAPYEEAAPALLELAGSHPGDSTRALSALSRYTTPALARDLLERWPRWTPAVRPQVVEVLLKRPERVRELLSALESGSMKVVELSAAQQASLRSHRDETLRQRATVLLGRMSTAPGDRQKIVARFAPALALKGNVAAGRTIFQARCATCHKLGNEGHALGPDLATVKNGGKEKLLANIIDPNREMNGNFVSYAIETRDGESLSGIIAGENAGSVTLRMAGGVETVLSRANIARLQSEGRSLMPEGLEEGLSPAQMADLLEFILAE